MEGYLYINHIEEEIFESHLYLTSQLHEIENLNKRVTDLIMEMGLLVTVAREERFRPFYGQAKEREGFDGPLQDRSNMFESKCVCISRKDLLMLKKSLFRITRGNSWIYEMDIRLDELNNYFGLAKHRTLADQILKNRILCLVVYQKGERNVLQSKINRFFGCLDCHILMAEINNLR